MKRQAHSRTFSSGRLLSALLMWWFMGACAARQDQLTSPTGVLAERRDDAPQELVSAMAETAARLARVGFEPYPGVELQGFIANGGRRERLVELPAEMCLTLVALSSRGVGDMDAALYTADGEILASDAQPDAHPAIQICGGEVPTRLYYVVHAYEGAGSFIMRAFRGPRVGLNPAAQELGGQPAVAPSPSFGDSVDDKINGFAQGLQKRGYEPLEAPLRLSLAPAQSVRVAVPVEGGRCYAVGAFGLAGLSDVTLRILNDSGQEVVLDEAPMEHAQVQFCATQQAQFIAETTAKRGQGDATLVLYRGRANQVLAGTGLWLGKSADQQVRRSSLTEAVAKSLDRARSEGFGAPSSQSDGYLQPGQVIERPLHLAGRRCHRLVVTPDVSLAQLHATVSVDGGALTPLTDVPLCLSGAGHLVVRLEALRGYGRFMLTLFER